MTALDIDPALELAAALPQAPHWPRAAYLTALDPDASPHRVAWVAEDGETNALAGFAVASVPGTQAELETIAVHTAWQRRRVARWLFAALSGELSACDATLVLLEVRASNHPALALYRALGFQETGRRPRYYANPVEDAVLLERKLE
jgi:ribosomal-protein-alanine N-acetyltransferase